MFGFIESGKKPSFFSPHLPSLITWNPKEKDFPMNLACKGVGLVAEEQKLEYLIEEINKILEEVKGLPFKETLGRRIDAALLLYRERSNIDAGALGGIEIFETTSFKNIIKNPQVSLFYIGSLPGYRSFQINCIAEIQQSESIFYKFMKSMRELFEEASFHFQQPKYPFAIKYHVIEVLDKTLKLRHWKMDKQ